MTVRNRQGPGAVQGYNGPRVGIGNVPAGDATQYRAAANRWGAAADVFAHISAGEQDILTRDSVEFAKQEGARTSADATTTATVNGPDGATEIQIPKLNKMEGSGRYAQAFNASAADTYSKRLELQARTSVKQLEDQYQADPAGLEKALGALSPALFGNVETVNPAVAADLKFVYGAMGTDAVLRAKDAAFAVQKDANQAAILQTIDARQTSYSQYMRRAGSGDKVAQGLAALERKGLENELVKHGPQIPYEVNGVKYPAGDGSVSAEFIQGQMVKLDREGAEQTQKGWWEAGPVDQNRADAWYKADQPGITQDQKDKLYNGMLADVKEKDYRIQKAQYEADRAAAKANDANWSTFEIGVSRGQLGYADVETAYNGGKGWMTPSQHTAATLALDKRTEQDAKAKAAFDWAGQAVAGNVVVDPKNNDQREAINEHFKETVQSWVDDDPATQQAKTLDYISKVGLVPDVLRGQLRGQLRSGTPDQVLAASNMIEQIRKTNPEILNDFAKEDIERATMLAQQTSAGVPIENAIANVDEAQKIDPTTKEARIATYGEYAQQGRAQGETQEAFLKRGLQASLNSFKQKYVPLVTNPDIPDGMAAEFDALRKDSYARTGNMDAANQFATDSIKRVWSVSTVNGPAKWTKFAPEAYYGAPPNYGLSEAEQGKWIKDQAVADFLGDSSMVDTESGPVADRLSIVATGKVDQNQRPLYNLIFKNSEGAFVPAQDAQGKALYWQPDFSTSPVKAKMDAATKEGVDLARLKREKPDEYMKRLFGGSGKGRLF